MLITFIIIYLAVTLFIGVFSSRYVKNSSDFILAGRQLSMAMAVSTEFATWFGSETVMGASSKMAEGGLLAVIEDPFGAALCLILVGLFFARPLYRMKLLTFGDYYRTVFGRRAELVASVLLIISYLGWIAAQMVAIGIVLNIVTGIHTGAAIAMASCIVIAYTFWGGMWSVAVTDVMQMVFIITGLIVASVIVIGQVGGLDKIISETPAAYFRFLPENDIHHWVLYSAAWITIGLGSIPQQDVYQRVMSSRTEKIAVNSSYISALLYLSIALLPLLLGLAARILLPGQEDTQYLLPNLIMNHTGLWVKIFFFGALLSGIMSTASGALLAPSVVLSENILRPLMKNMDDKKFLLITRLSILAIALVSLGMALLRHNIYELVGEASQISLVSLFVPLCAGLFFKNKNETAALISMLAGVIIWFITIRLETDFPPIFFGLFSSLAGFLAGVLFPGKTAIAKN